MPTATSKKSTNTTKRQANILTTLTDEFNRNQRLWAATSADIHGEISAERVPPRIGETFALLSPLEAAPKRQFVAITVRLRLFFGVFYHEARRAVAESDF